MKSNIQIKQAGIPDREVVARLFDNYRQFYNQPPDLDGAKHFISARLQNGDSIIFLAVIENNADRKIAGFIQLYPSFSSISMKRSYILNDLFVDPSYRNMGVARQLMERAHRTAIETGAAELTLMTAKGNQIAQSLYRSLGWKADEEFLPFSIDF